jgi:hypothetical protein
MDFQGFLKHLVKLMGPALSHAGFQYLGSGLWNRFIGQTINIIWIQKQSTKPVCCVNLGIHYRFLPEAGTEKVLTSEKLDLPSCEIKLRLTADPAQADQWWPFSPQTSETIRDLIIDRAFNIFDSYKLEGEISKLEAKDLEESMPSLLASLTKVRAALLLARIHEHLGNRAKAIDAANFGINIGGSAVGPKKAMRDILKRCEQPE